MKTPSLARRLQSVALALVVAGAALAPVDADARAGRSGGVGSRGSKTFSAPPPTATAPGAAPIQRSMTQPGQPGAIGAPSAAAGAQAARKPGMFGGALGAGLMGGLLGAGLFGLLSGSGLFGGLGSLTSFLGLLIQAAIIFFVVRLALRWWANRKAGHASPATAGGPSGYSFDAGGGGGRRAPLGRPTYGLGGSSYGAAGASSAQPALGEVKLDGADFDAFERLLTEVQDAWSNQDLPRMRGLVTPEMVEMFSEDLADDASRGVSNKVSGVKLLQGDLAEAWSESGRDYATVAMRYALTDVTVDTASGRIVDGDPNASVEATELWTFVRVSGGRWLLSAIQQQA